MTASFKDDFALAEAAVRAAGKIALDFLGKDNFDTWLKRGVEPVTEIDLKINTLLKAELTGKRPDYGWLSEECADQKDRLGKDRVWIVDPIDGTRAFMRGKSDFAISVALVEREGPVIGLLFAPARDEFYTAVKGHGAFLNGEKIHVGAHAEISGMRLQGDRDYFTSKRWLVAWPDMTINKYQSFALRVTGVARGKYDAALSARPKSEWDVAAAGLILEEAGGVVCDQNGKRFSYNQENTRLQHIIATTPRLKDKILAQLKNRKPKSNP